MEKQRKGISKSKDFKYPPILPILFYDGEDNWTAAASLHERVLLSDVLGKYIPNYQYHLMQLKNYSNFEFMQQSDEMSVVMMVTNLHDIAGLEKLKTEVDSEYIQNVFAGTPEYLVNIVYQVAEALLRKLRIPEDQIRAFTGQIKEVQMGELFTVLERNWLKEREELMMEGKTEGKIEGVVQTVKHMKGTIEIAAQQLMEQCGLGSDESIEKAKLYW